MTPTSRFDGKEFASRQLRPLPRRGDPGRKGLLGSPGARRERRGRSPGLRRAQSGSPSRAAGGAAGTGRRRGGHGAAGSFSRGGSGDAESRICHRVSPLSSPRGPKQKRKRMRLAGRLVPELRPPPPPGRWTSARAGGGASRPGRVREAAGGGAAEVRPWPGRSGAAGPAPSPRCCSCCCCSGRWRRGVRSARLAGGDAASGKGRPRGRGRAPARRGLAEGRGDGRLGAPRPTARLAWPPKAGSEWPGFSFHFCPHFRGEGKKPGFAMRAVGWEFHGGSEKCVRPPRKAVRMPSGRQSPRGPRKTAHLFTCSDRVRTARVPEERRRVGRLRPGGDLAPTPASSELGNPESARGGGSPEPALPGAAGRTKSAKAGRVREE